MAVLAFLATLFTTTTLGAAWFVFTRTDLSWNLMPWLSTAMIQHVWSNPELLRAGLLFSLPTLFILGCHEMGHYLACRRYRVPATPPFFLPAPFGLGTLGAFIRIRAAIRNRRELFDIGFAGPAAGMIALIPFLLLGAAWSQPAEIARAEEHEAVAELLVPGHGLALRAAFLLAHGAVPPDAVWNYHPFALAAWVGLFATALNLLPLAQLDGGHLLYAWAGPAHRRFVWPLWGILVAFAFLWPGWALWCAVVLLMGLRHPPTRSDTEPLDRRRTVLAAVAVALLVLSFVPVPLSSVLVR